MIRVRSLLRVGSLLCISMLVACSGDEEPSVDEPNGPETASIDGGRPPGAIDGGGSSAPVDAGVTGTLEGTDRAVEPPPGDCSKAEGDCIQAYGAFHRTAFVCLNAPGHRVFAGAGKGEQMTLFAQLFSCDGAFDTLETMVPTGRVGPYAYDLSVEDGSRAGIYIKTLDASGKRAYLGSDAPGFVGRLVGSVSSNKRVRGTLSGRWPGASEKCEANTADTACDESWVLMTFNLPVL